MYQDSVEMVLAVERARRATGRWTKFKRLFKSKHPVVTLMGREYGKCSETNSGRHVEVAGTEGICIMCVERLEILKMKETKKASMSFAQPAADWDSVHPQYVIEEQP